MESLLLVDLSPAGCAVVVPGDAASAQRSGFVPTSAATLELALPGEAAASPVSVSVRNVVPLRSGNVRVGLEFVETPVAALDPLRARIEEFILARERSFAVRAVGWRTK